MMEEEGEEEEQEQEQEQEEQEQEKEKEVEEEEYQPIFLRQQHRPSRKNQTRGKYNEALNTFSL